MTVAIVNDDGGLRTQQILEVEWATMKTTITFRQ